jgi:4-hydroxybenzoyl-CoA thioesterase
MKEQGLEAPFEARFPVRFHDVDRAGIIFFAKILEYCHVAFEELLTALEFPPRRFYEDEGFGAPFANVTANFFAPLRHGDTMVIRLHINRLGRTSMGIRYTLSNQEGVKAAEITTVQVFVRFSTLEPLEIPPHVRRVLERVMVPPPPDAPAECRGVDQGASGGAPLPDAPAG